MKWLVPIMGFTESVSRPTGIERLWSELRGLASPTVTVLMPWEWRDDMRALAEFIVRNSPGSAARVFVFAYSWGAGYAFPRFARQCELLGVSIDEACLCDPVYRSGLLPWWLPLNPLALVGRSRIGIPSSVARVHWVRQKLTLPCGHDLFPEDPEATDIAPEIVLQEGHCRIDSHPTWLGMVKSDARFWAEAGEKAGIHIHKGSDSQRPGVCRV